MMEDTPIREARTIEAGETDALRHEEQLHLISLVTLPAWPTLLKLMEWQCIQEETALINTPADDDAAVLANHKMAKAAWNFFVKLQKRVLREVEEGIEGANKAANSHRPTQENTLMESRPDVLEGISDAEILDPMKTNQPSRPD